MTEYFMSLAEMADWGPLEWYQKKVYWFWGESGTGKTAAAYGTEFDGLHKDMYVFDNFHANAYGSVETTYIELCARLRIILHDGIMNDCKEFMNGRKWEDEYYGPWRAKVIIIIANESPTKMFGEVNISPMSEVRHFTRGTTTTQEVYNTNNTRGTGIGKIDSDRQLWHRRLLAIEEDEGEIYWGYDRVQIKSWCKYIYK